MIREHEVTIYRRDGTPTEDAQGRETKAWAPVATAVPCILQMLSGSVELLAPGRDREGTALLLIAAEDLPDGVDVKESDGVVVTAGRFPFQRFVVTEVNQVAGRGMGWDDECLLEDTEESIP